MNSYVTWDSIKKEGGTGGGIFLKLQAGSKYRLRLVGSPLKYLQHWTMSGSSVTCRSPGTDPTTGQIVDPLMLMGEEPKVRFAMWVLNRDDGNKLQIIDFPPQLAQHFALWKEGFNDEPGGKNGPDWQIKLDAPGGVKSQTKYSALALDRAPFTEEELKRIQDGKLRERLDDVRRANTPEEIRAMLADKKAGGTGRLPAKGQGAPAATAAQAAAPAPVVTGKVEDDPLSF